MDQPRMRASYIHDNLRALSGLGADEVRIREKLGAEFISHIEKTNRLDWMPLEIDITLTRAVFDVAGLEGVRQWSRLALLRSIEGPLLRPIVSAAVAILGLSPSGILKRSGNAYKSIYTDCGDISMTTEDVRDNRPHVTMTIAHAPRLFLNNPFYVHGIAGAYEGVFVICKVTGDVEVAAFPDQQRICLEVVWSPK